MYPTYLNGTFAHSWGNRRCRCIVHSADVSAMILIHEFPERTTKYAENINYVVYAYSRRTKRALHEG